MEIKMLIIDPEDTSEPDTGDEPRNLEYDPIGSTELDAGVYRVTIKLTKGDETITINEILHIYQSLDSEFSMIFTKNHFPVTLLNIFLSAWNKDSGTWNLSDKGITAGHFSYLGIDKVYDDNFNDIEEWFNDLCNEDSTIENFNDIRNLTYAVLLNIASEDNDFLNTAYTHKSDAEEKITALADTKAIFEFDWADDSKSVIVLVEGGYLIEFDFDVVIYKHPVLEGEVSIIGSDVSMAVGQELKADISELMGSSSPLFQWYRGDDEIPGAESDTYAIQFADHGSVIKVRVSREENTGFKYSEPTNAVPIGPVTITGTPRIGEELKQIQLTWGEPGRLLINR